MAYQNTQTEDGFTLIELLVTVGIVGVLASIAIPEFNEYRKRAYHAASVNLAHDLAVATTVIAGEMEQQISPLGNAYHFSKNGGTSTPAQDQGTNYTGVGLTELVPGVTETDFYVNVTVTNSVIQGLAKHCKGTLSYKHYSNRNGTHDSGIIGVEQPAIFHALFCPGY